MAILTKEQIKEMEEKGRPLMEYMSKLGHPHFTAIVSYDRIEVLEGSASFVTEDYVLD